MSKLYWVSYTKEIAKGLTVTHSKLVDENELEAFKHSGLCTVIRIVEIEGKNIPVGNP